MAVEIKLPLETGASEESAVIKEPKVDIRALFEKITHGGQIEWTDELREAVNSIFKEICHGIRIPTNQAKPVRNEDDWNISDRPTDYNRR